MRRVVWFGIVVLLAAVAVVAWNDSVRMQDRLVALYTQAFDSLVNWDQAKAAGLQYVAIDTTRLGGLDDDSVKEVLAFFRGKYGVETLSGSLQDLRDQGRATEVGLINGILFRVDKARFWLNRVATIEVSEYRGNLGAYGETFAAWFLFGRWNLGTQGSWVS